MVPGELAKSLSRLPLIPATLGVSAAFMEVQAFDHQLALADAALYRGKKSGRNCVQWAGPEDASGDKPGDQAGTTLTV